MLKSIAVVTAFAIVGNMVADRWVLKATPDDPNGFVPITPGFGADEIARGLAVALAIVAGKKLLGSIL